MAVLKRPRSGSIGTDSNGHALSPVRASLPNARDADPGTGHAYSGTGLWIGGNVTRTPENVTTLELHLPHGHGPERNDHGTALGGRRLCRHRGEVGRRGAPPVADFDAQRAGEPAG